MVGMGLKSQAVKQPLPPRKARNFFKLSFLNRLGIALRGLCNSILEVLLVKLCMQ